MARKTSPHTQIGVIEGAAAPSHADPPPPATGRAEGQDSVRAVRRERASKPAAADDRGTWRQYRYSGAAGSRGYRVYVPAGLRRTSQVPLLLALHGCRQNGLEFAASTRFNQLADKHRFVVATPSRPACTIRNGAELFRPAHQFRAHGEPGIMAGIVYRVMAQTTHWRIDPRRVYVAGLSAGGVMAVVLAGVYPELFAAVGVHSAPRTARRPVRATPCRPCGAGRSAATRPAGHRGDASDDHLPGSRDGIVHADNAQHIADQWLVRHGTGARLRGRINPPRRPRVTSSGPPRPSTPRSRRGYRVSRWSTATERKALAVWLVDGLSVLAPRPRPDAEHRQPVSAK